MKFDDLLITTGVDALVRLIKEKKRIELDITSQLLSIPQETIEEWARVLEEEGIIKIDYRLTKVYLSWVTPTESELAEEKESFVKGKEELKGEIETIRSTLEPELKQTEDLRKSFDELYAKLYPRLKALEESVSALPAARPPEERADAYIGRIAEMSGKVEGMQRSLKETSKEMAALEKAMGRPEELGKRMEALTAKLAAMEGMEKELLELKQRVEEQQRSMPPPAQMPSVKELRAKHDEMRKEFAELRKRTAAIREDMTNLAEGTEILKSVGDSIKEYEKKVQDLRKELKPLLKDADALNTRVGKVNESLKEDSEAIERFADSVTVAKGILTRFPSQKSVLDELQRIKGMEESLAEKNAALDGLLKAVGGGKVSAAETADMGRRIERMMGEMRGESEELAKALEEEKGTFQTYQRVREKVLPALDEYQRRMAELSGSLAKMRDDIAGEAEKVEAELSKVETIVGGAKAKEILRMAEEVRQKKALMEDIKGSLDSMVESAENLNRRLNLLSKEAALLEMRGGGDIGPAASSDKEVEVRRQLALTKDEELEFRRKRQELRGLIKKLWEDEVK